MPNDKEKPKKPPAPPAANDPILARYYADIHNISLSLASIAEAIPAIVITLNGMDESLESIDESLESIIESSQDNNAKLLLILAQIAECVCGSNVTAQSSTLVLKAGDKSE